MAPAQEQLGRYLALKILDISRLINPNVHQIVGSKALNIKHPGYQRDCGVQSTIDQQ
jgi:hypothetical protein